MNRRNRSPLIFLIVSVLAVLYLLVEGILQLFGRSICATEGCRVVAQYARFGDLSLVLLGLGMFSLLAILAFLDLRGESAWRQQLTDALLVVSLAGEGFLVGYQLFWLHAVCVFCLGVLGFYLVLGGLRILAGRRNVLAGLLSLAAILSLFALLLPAGGSALPLTEKHVLFYSPDCKHCAEITREMEALKIEAQHVQVQAYAPTLKGLGIEHVPTLLVNGPYEKVFLTGTDAIRRYLATCRPLPAAPLRRPAGAARPPAAQQPAPLMLFPGSASPGQLFSPPPDQGLCKEDTKCD